MDYVCRNALGPPHDPPASTGATVLIARKIFAGDARWKRERNAQPRQKASRPGQPRAAVPTFASAREHRGLFLFRCITRRRCPDQLYVVLTETTTKPSTSPLLRPEAVKDW